MEKQDVDTKIGLVAFNNVVTCYGDGIEDPQII